MPDSWNSVCQGMKMRRDTVCFRNHNRFSGTRTKDTQSMERRQEGGNDGT